MPRFFLLFVAFVSGMSVMMLEIAAARLLAPYFGTSIFVWTNIIGVVLIALAVGSYVGGRIADRWPREQLLFLLIGGAGMLGFAIPFVAGALARAISATALLSGDLFIFSASLIATAVLFAVPLCILGMVSPFLITLYAKKQHHVGSSSGTVFAVSTIGSILGTFLPTLLFIPALGTRMTIFAASLILVAAALLGLLHSRILRIIAITFLTLVGFFLSTVGFRTTPPVVHAAESAYHFLRVTEDRDGTRTLLFNEGRGLQSLFHPDRFLTGHYYDFYATLPLLFSAERTPRVLILGLAGGTMSRQLAHFYDGRLPIDGVEIDQKVLDIASDYFDLAQPNLTVHNDDGLLFLQRSRKRYDLVFIDAYQDQLVIPWTMTTQEFWQLVSDRLSPDGVLAMNVASNAKSPLVQAITNTQASVFATVLAVSTDKPHQNTMVLATQRPPETISFRETAHDELRPFVQHILASAKRIHYKNDDPFLTNDKAPVEFLTNLF